MTNTFLMALALLAAQEPPRDNPFNDTIHLATSKDGLTWVAVDEPLREKASVPDIVELSVDSAAGKKGSVLVYTVDFSKSHGPGSEGVSLLRTENGKDWDEAKPIRVKGKVHKGAAVDPSVVELPDGRLRLFFFGPEMKPGQDPGRQEGPHRIYSATSKDGVEFEADAGVRYEEERITDPEVIRAGDEWIMFLSRGDQTLLARSKDGLEYRKEKDFLLRGGGVPGAVALEDGRVRIYQSSRGGIRSALWDPRKSDPPVPEDGMRIERGESRMVADPACVRRLDGTFLMIFKRR